jgi:DNA-binding transcriptional LysR family regulator
VSKTHSTWIDNHLGMVPARPTITSRLSSRPCYRARKRGWILDLDLRLVRYFVVVADELHFGRAAAKLHVSQPALSKQIRKLEDQLGARLLVRDSRHVSLTVRGESFLRDARELLNVAERMQQRPEENRVRIAHIFELSTSREVADAYSRARPEVTIIEHAMESFAQLDALLEDRLDVAILRVTPEMVINHPTGWSHALLRLEPMRLVGRQGDARRPTASMFERPIEVFADPPGSGLNKAYRDFLTALERFLGLSMRWLGTPGAFSHCLAVVKRSTVSAFQLELDSYAVRYAAEGLPVFNPEEALPHYPWSIAWRDGRIPHATADFLEIAQDTATVCGWRNFENWEGARPWLPPDDPVAQELGFEPQMDRAGSPQS